MRKLFLVLFFVYISIQLSCAKTAYLRSDQAIRQPFDKNAAIYIKAPETLTVEEANFMVLLREGIEKSGLNTEEDLSKADYVMSFAISEPMLVGQSFGYEPVFPPPQLTQEWQIYYYPVSYIYGYPGLKINITVFKKRNFLASPHMPLWEASLVVKKEVYPEHCEELIKIILDRVGQRFEGRVKVP